MKIIDENTKEDLSDVVAYISGGSLVIKSVEDGTSATVLVLTPANEFHYCTGDISESWTPNAQAVTKVFRKGDRITLEF